ncbi:hypothetical protein EVAR_53891_1 [Eumeta japonica]|uniref:Uncharacterized protein n=1 Tax=Eumeta variegata TaxID=151549 RepID=A0A4C1YDN8_EUMVA|nr:hypothetical protein EVAR_53891_1 [Eumeta japonica]
MFQPYGLTEDRVHAAPPPPIHARSRNSPSQSRFSIERLSHAPPECGYNLSCHVSEARFVARQSAAFGTTLAMAAD